MASEMKQVQRSDMQLQLINDSLVASAGQLDNYFFLLPSPFKSKLKLAVIDANTTKCTTANAGYVVNGLENNPLSSLWLKHF